MHSPGSLERCRSRGAGSTAGAWRAASGSRAAGPRRLRALRADPPDAVVIDLSRLPSHGRNLGAALRQSKATRGIPLVFVGDDPAKVARVRELLPDAIYTDWAGIRTSLAGAMAHPPPNRWFPPRKLAGYSGTPLPRKLGIKPGYAVALVGAPEGFERILSELPADVTLRRRAQGRCDLIVWFVGARRDLERRTARYGAKAGAGRALDLLAQEGLRRGVRPVRERGARGRAGPRLGGLQGRGHRPDVVRPAFRSAQIRLRAHRRQADAYAGLGQRCLAMAASFRSVPRPGRWGCAGAHR